MSSYIEEPDKTKYISSRIPIELFDKLVEDAREDQRTVSMKIKLILEDYFKRKESK